MIALSAIPTYVDIADATFAVDQPVKASTLQQMSRNAKFASVRREIFQCVATNGQTISAPTSPIDGYQYSYAEIAWWWTRANSYSQATQKPSGGGCILSWTDNVTQQGVVTMTTNYFIDGGAESVTNDGELVVWLLCQRAVPAFAAVATWADVEDADLAGGQALLASNLLQMNKNIRYGVVRKEFFVQKLYNGQTIAPCVSPVDGYTYQLQLQAAIAAPPAPTLTQVAAGTLGAQTVYVQTTYVNQAGETTASAESTLAVSADNVPHVASPAASGNATGYNVYLANVSGSELLQNTSPIPIGTAWQMPTTGIARGAAAPTANTTAMSEMHFLGSMISSLPQGGHTSGSGTARAYGVAIGGMPAVTTPAAFGQVSCFVNYYVNGGAYSTTNDGTVLVLIVCTRERGFPPIPPAVRTQPPPATMTQFGTLMQAAGTTVGGFPIKGVGDPQQLNINAETDSLLDYDRHCAAVTAGLTTGGNLQSGRLAGGDSGVGLFGGGGQLGFFGAPGAALDFLTQFMRLIAASPYSLLDDTTASTGRQYEVQSSGGPFLQIDATAAAIRTYLNGTGQLGVGASPSYEFDVAALVVDVFGSSVAAWRSTDTAGGGRMYESYSGGGDYIGYDVTAGSARGILTGSGLQGFGGRTPAAYAVEAAGTLASIAVAATMDFDDLTASTGRDYYYRSTGGVFGAADNTAGAQRTYLSPAGFMGVGRSPATYELEAAGGMQAVASGAGLLADDTGTSGVLTLWQSVSGELAEFVGGIQRRWQVGADASYGGTPVAGYPISLLGVGLFDANAYMRASLGPYSTALNLQGNLPATAMANGWLSLAFGTTPTPYWQGTWAAQKRYRSDGSYLSIAASTSLATPPTPTISAVAGGSQASRTCWGACAYVRNGVLYGQSATASNITVGASQLLQMASPAAVAGYDGWIPLPGRTGIATCVPADVLSGGKIVPIAFGTAWTEPAAGFSAYGYPSAAATWMLGAYSTTYYLYPALNLATGLLEFCGANPLTSPDVAAATAQSADGMVALSAGGIAVTLPASGGGSGSGSGGGGGGGKGLL